MFLLKYFRGLFAKPSPAIQPMQQTTYLTDIMAAWPILKTGTWHYGNGTDIAVRIVESPLYSGSGDYEDPPEISDDRDEICYCIGYEASGCPAKFIYWLNIPTLAEAISLTEEKFPGIRWDAVS